MSATPTPDADQLKAFGLGLGPDPAEEHACPFLLHESIADDINGATDSADLSEPQLVALLTACTASMPDGQSHQAYRVLRELYRDCVQHLGIIAAIVEGDLRIDALAGKFAVRQSEVEYRVAFLGQHYQNAQITRALMEKIQTLTGMTPDVDEIFDAEREANEKGVDAFSVLLERGQRAADAAAQAVSDPESVAGEFREV